MIRPVVNTILEWIDSDSEKSFSERVLWRDPKGELIVVISISDWEALPTIRSQVEIEDAFEREIVFRRTIDPFASLTTPDPNTPAKHLEIRDQVWEKICRLVAQEPEIYDEKFRRKLIMQDPIASKGSMTHVYEYLRRYWKRGMTKNALLPDYGKCGAPGKDRKCNEAKRGRKSILARNNPDQAGVNIDDKIKDIFNISVKHYFNNRDENPLRRAYDLMIANFFNTGFQLKGGIQVPIIPPAHTLPTLGQFAYWFHRKNDLIHSIVSRKGRRSYELNHRPVLGDSTQMAFGPGSIFQIDATIADVYLVSAINRSWIIGRPVVYFCVDAFSHLVTGLYVGLEGPSWLTGMMALANATTDKVSYCAEYGIEITADDWPCSYLPEQTLADRGEFIGCSSDNLVESLNISFANTATFRGDMKAIVERSFRRANETSIKWLPGAVRKREPGDGDYRLDATLTLHEFTKIMILMTIEYNLFHRIDHYPFGRDMMNDEVEPIPLELWNWGIANRTGHLREKSPEIVMLSLLPRNIATITFRGICFQGMYYSCNLAIKEQWFVKAKQSGSWTHVVSYDPRKVDIIYLHAGKGTLEPCQLLPREERYKDLRLEEVLDYQKTQKLKSARHKSNKNQSMAELNAHIDAIVENALNLTEAAKPRAASKRQRLKNIRANRQAENKLLRNREAFDLRSGRNNHKEPIESIFNVDTVITNTQSDDEVVEVKSINQSNKSRLLDILKKVDEEK